MAAQTNNFDHIQLQKSVRQCLLEQICRLLVGRFRLFALVSALNSIVNFTAVHWHFTGGFHPQANLVTANLDYDNRNLVIDDDALVLFAR